MRPAPPSSGLSRSDQLLLRAAGRLVPAAQRAEWSRAWHAELWHKRHGERKAGGVGGPGSHGLNAGLVCDALWLRAEIWRRRFERTALLCLASLAVLCLMAAMFALLLYGGRLATLVALADQLDSSLIAAPLIVLVTFAVAPRQPVEAAAPRKGCLRLKRHTFFASKIGLLLLLSFLLSAEVCEPLHLAMPLVGGLLRIFCFVLFALLALRWALRDQEQRCNHCLRSLAEAARVGRPSRNLLEWNGTERACTEGHGRLSVPELETSWCRSSRWTSQSATATGQLPA